VRGCTVSDDGGSKSFNGTSAKSLNNASAENRVVSRGIGSPDVRTKEHGEGGDDSGSFSENQGQWNPNEVAQSESEHVVVGQKRDLIDRDLEELRIWEKENRETRRGIGTHEDKSASNDECGVLEPQRPIERITWISTWLWDENPCKVAGLTLYQISTRRGGVWVPSAITVPGATMCASNSC